MADDDGKVQEFTEDEADEIVGVPATQNFWQIDIFSKTYLLLNRFLK